jgi:serine/threonine-protein kinase
MNQELSANTTLSHYRIVSKIGAGGMGEVYLAQDTSELGRTVALKVLPPEVAKDKDRLDRFKQEARTVSNLNHPNIITVHEFGQTESACFIATEYIDGVTLREHLSSRRLKLIDVLDVTIQVVAAFNAAHDAGVTHRDLKPENVMVRRDHIVKVLDFGLAKLSEPQGASSDADSGEDAATKVLVHTQPGMVMGTVNYMSPEQSIGKGVDHRTDIWSVGVVLYEMMAGCLPFQGKDIHRQIISIQEADPLPLSQHVEGVPERLEEIVTKCLAKDKNERYQTAKDLLIDLRNLRRKLDVDAEIERTIVPAQRSTSAGGSLGTQGSKTSAAPTDAAQMRTTSSAEYIVTGIKQHRLAAIIVLLLLITAGIGYGSYLHARNTEVAIESIGVLPFEDKSNDADTDYLSDGLAESLIYRLSQLPNLKVSPTTSVLRYKGKDTDVAKIARELGVEAILTGRLLKRGDNLNITVELIDIRKNKSLWGEQYQRKMSDLLATQREIAATIVEKLELKLAGNDTKGITKRYTDSNDAYQLYLKGRYYFGKRTKDGIERSIESYQQAIALDPNFALAYARIAESYNQVPSYPYGSPKETIPRAKAAAQQALQIDPTLAEAHTALANSLVVYDWNLVDAEREFKLGIELDPNSSAAHFRYGQIYLAPRGQFGEAIDEIKRGLDAEPLDINMGSTLSWVYAVSGQNDKALEQARKVYELEPSHPLGRWNLGFVYIAAGMYSEAIELSERNLQDDPTNQRVLWNAGFAYAKAGRRDKAEEVINRFKELARTQYIAHCRIGCIYGALGDKDKAFAEFEKALEDRDWDLYRISIDPLFTPLRDDPRFKEMLKRLNLAA